MQFLQGKGTKKIRAICLTLTYVRLDWSQMSEEETDFVEDLIRASNFDIVRPNEVERYVKEGVLLTCMIFTRYMK